MTTSYDIRYSTANITANNWTSVTQVSGEPIPQIAGTSQSIVVSGLNPSTQYYFAMKTSDESGNISPLSNVVNATTLAQSQTPICEATGSGKCYYVQNTNSSCSDTGLGSFEQPFCKVNKAATIAQAGDFVYIRAGIYDEISGVSCEGIGKDCGTLYPRNSGTKGNPITFIGYPGEDKPIIKGNPLNRYAVTLIGRNYITLDSLEVTEGYRGIWLPVGVGVIIRNNHIHHNSGTTNGNNNGGICIVEGSQEIGNIRDILIENNIIHDNLDVSVFNNGILIYSCWNCTIRNNLIYNEQGGIFVKNAVGNGSNVDMWIYNNTIRDTKDGIFIGGQGGVRNIFVYDNLLYRLNTRGFGGSIGPTPSENVNYFNNTVDCGGSPAGFYQWTGSNEFTKVKNNILYNCTPGRSVTLYNYFNKYPYPSTYLQSKEFEENNNLMTNSGGDNRYYSWGSEGNPEPLWTYQQWRNYWQTQVPPEHPENGIGDLFAIPQFVDFANNNYSLQSTSPAIDNGTLIPGFHCALSDDVNPNQTGCRHWSGLAPDIGAFEYTGAVAPDLTPPTVSITAPAPSSTVNSVVTISATASDNISVLGVQFRLDGVSLGTEDTTAPYALTWDTTRSPNGAHILTAIARDAAGNSATASPINVTISNLTLPSSTLAVSLVVSPQTGLRPLTVDLAATVAGLPPGPITYTFYCDRPDPGTNQTSGSILTQTVPAAQVVFAAPQVCTYSQPGNYTPKVIVESGSLATEARTTVAVSAPAVPSNPTGPGGGGGDYWNLPGSLPNPATSTPTSTLVKTYLPLLKLTAPLYPGITHAQVVTLQKMLNNLGSSVATIGPGAPGSETTYYGNKTKGAVAKFQLNIKIIPSLIDSSAGLVGPKTRSALNSAYATKFGSASALSTDPTAIRALIQSLLTQVQALQLKLSQMKGQ